MDVLVISGLSGGGKSTALRALEDLGAYCVDNMPVPLLTQLVELVGKGRRGPTIAVGIDCATTENMERFTQERRKLLEGGHSVDIVFVEAARRDVLVRRYSETRRMHPDGRAARGDRPRAGAPRADSCHERPADRHIDPVGTPAAPADPGPVRQSRHAALWCSSPSGSATDVPSEADIVIDSAVPLDNPYERPDLRPLSGLHEPVRSTCLGQARRHGAAHPHRRLGAVLRTSFGPRGRSYLTVAIGCTGGQHRSVALVEELKQRLQCTESRSVDPAPRLVVRHRDVGGTA